MKTIKKQTEDETDALNYNLNDLKRITFKDKNTKRKVFYRKQDLSDESVFKYKNTISKKSVFYSPSFLSTSTDKSVAESFIRPGSGNDGVLFEINGFSPTFIRSNFSPKNEKEEHILSPLASFVVANVGLREVNPKQRLIKLKEVDGNYPERIPLYY
ncbi:hypothetical protein L085_07485 [Serratia sp. FS14]|uniref:hypothetical protein n=1 Tax=Serratia sp. (strain FS14) TaxID=1327989 RepID=UPI0004997B09|nr:hypothetical protein [Serratia sp. FS14]AIA46948.1 hypothetical protein L085_07485 [Serratia sp. FS14]